MELKNMHCKSYEGKIDPLSEEEENKLFSALKGWTIDKNSDIHKLQKTVKSETFLDAVNTLRDIALIADSENHHPDFHLYYNKLKLELTTHKANGLTENDFILAAKIDNLLERIY